jgi:ABC-type Fe3+-hydroxamate transport system substrate-binding protein
MRLVVLAAVAMLVTACQRLEEADNVAPGCDARAASTWAAGEAQYSVEAMSAGPDCVRAVATIVVRDASGAPLYAEAHLAQHVMVLAPATTEAAMQTALADWSNPANNTTMLTTSALPDWPQGAAGPQNGEFPFYPEPGYDRDTYMAIRAENAPLFCYVQGMESMSCLALRNGALEKIGVQAFPG